METLESSKTLADDPSKPPGSQTLEPSEIPSFAPNEGDVESRVSEPAETLAAAETVAGAVEDDGEDAIPFKVGDFVWAKMKKINLWFPGRVLDPSRAPDHAEIDRRCVLVSYFGDFSFAWCEPSQLKPFGQEFNQMAKQSTFKGFVEAVREALDLIGRGLESKLMCCCVPPKARAQNVGEFSIANYDPMEFLEFLRDVALDASMANLLQATMLKSWVVVVGKMCLVSGEFVFREPREIEELVDKVDLDDPFAEPGSREEECWIPGNLAVKKPEVSEEKLYRSRKRRRSMAKLIAEMDSDSVEHSDVEEEEEVAPNKFILNVKREEEHGWGRRERKKSKYLSPPYTYLGGIGKILSSTESKSPKKATKEASWALHSGSHLISKCNSDLLQDEEDKSSSPSFKIHSTPMAEIISEFLSAALNPMHLKWNRSAKTVREFFAILRRSVYSEGSDFDAYQKHLGDCGTIDKKSTDKEEGRTDSRAEEVNPSDSKKGKGRLKRKTRKEGDEVATSLDLGNAPSNRKRKKEGADVLTPLVLGQERKMRKGAKEKRSLDSVEGKSGLNIETPVDLNIEITSGLEESKSPHHVEKGVTAAEALVGSATDKKVCDEMTKPQVPVDLECGSIKGQKGRKKNPTSNGNPAAILMTFAPGVSLPSKENLISTFSKYGDLIKAETQLSQESGRARVVFVRSADAEMAIISSDKNAAFGPVVPSYRLSYLAGSPTPPQLPKPPLPYIRKSLERMISSLCGSSSPAKCDGLKKETRDNLVGEMKGLLTKVDKMLSGPTSGIPS